jgi:hypothetical protein
MQARSRLGFVIALIALTVATPLRHAHAQVSDADRQAARDLFAEGFQAQQAGRWAEALDKFQRAQAVFSAPTNLLHIAECQAQLGRLVESAETYRGLTHLQLPKDSPPPFVAAQQQGAAELQQVEARIPKIRIDVTPANVANLSVTIDEQPMNVALVGEERPIDPGTHKVVAFAPGYGQREATIVVREKDPIKRVALALTPTGGVVYTPVAPGTVVVGPGNVPPPGQPPPPVAPPPPPEQPPPPFVREERPRPSQFGFLLGVRVGYDAMTGGFTQNIDLGQEISGGGVFGLQAGARFGRRGYVGLIYEHGFYKAGSGISDLAMSYGANFPGTKVTPSGNFFGLDLGYITNPDGFGVVLDAALAYRQIGISSADNSFSASYSGGELVLGGGLWFKAGPSVRIVPRIDIGIGSFGDQTVQCNGGPCMNNAGSSVSNPQTHAIVFLGFGGYFNIDFVKKT